MGQDERRKQKEKEKVEWILLLLSSTAPELDSVVSTGSLMDKSRVG